jgi:hypothetical protein
VVLGSYLLGPMSVPSKSRNFTSIGSFPPAISPGAGSRVPPNQPLLLLLLLRSPNRLQEQPPRQEQGIGRGKKPGEEEKGCRKSAQEGQTPMRIPRGIRSSAARI